VVARVDSEQSTPEPQASLIVGSQMRCPNCEQLRDPLNERMFKRLDRNEKYARDLNVVYQCVKSTGGCGHIFSPGDQRILMAFLAGDLVPAKHVSSNGSQH
jgi:hypothetical protein